MFYLDLCVFNAFFKSVICTFIFHWPLTNLFHIVLANILKTVQWTFSKKNNYQINQQVPSQHEAFTIIPCIYCTILRNIFFNSRMFCYFIHLTKYYNSSAPIGIIIFLIVQLKLFYLFKEYFAKLYNSDMKLFMRQVQWVSLLCHTFRVLC